MKKIISLVILLAMTSIIQNGAASINSGSNSFDWDKTQEGQLAFSPESPSSWSELDVKTAINAGLVPQSLQSEYTQATTRAEFCILAVSLYETATNVEIAGRKTFVDTNNVNVEKAAAIGIVNGVGNNRFSPDDTLTREQAATMLSRLADVIGKPLMKQLAAFTDSSNISSWAIESVGQVQAAGIMSGVGNNTFEPKNMYTREQSIVTILRLYDIFEEAGMDSKSFVCDLLSAMPKDKNYMISPFSLKMALAMAANGASGDTKQEILNVLEITDLGMYNGEAKSFIESCNKNDAVDINVTNSTWNNTDRFNDPDLNFSDEYKKIVVNYYGGMVSNINNANGSKMINDWIAQQTRDKIKNVISDDTVKEAMSFLVNTIYFKGNWKVTFDVRATRDSTFTDRNGNESETAFMNNVGNYLYFEDNNVQMLAKPYEDSDIQMYFVLPKLNGHVQMTQYIKPYIFEDAVNNMSSRYIRFSLPKFKTESLHNNLVDIMRRMGIQTAFDAEKADFLSMYSKRPPLNMFIGNILQKTFIVVDEIGTEAAAATVVVMVPLGMPFESFICDKPFTYFIRNDATGDILFIGEYAFVE